MIQKHFVHIDHPNIHDKTYKRYKQACGLFLGGNCGHLAQNNAIKCKTTRNNDKAKPRETTRNNANQRETTQNNAKQCVTM